GRDHLLTSHTINRKAGLNSPAFLYHCPLHHCMLDHCTLGAPTITWFRICCTNTILMWMRFATSGRNSATIAPAGSVAMPIPMRFTVDGPSVWIPGTYRFESS